MDNPDNYEVKRDPKGKFLPGITGNPFGTGGRPVGTVSLVALLKQQLIDNPKEAEDIVKAFVKEGKAGDMRAIEELLNRIDGKVIERHKLEAEIPITLRFLPAALLVDQAIEGEYKEIKEGD